MQIMPRHFEIKIRKYLDETGGVPSRNAWAGSRAANCARTRAAETHTMSFLSDLLTSSSSRSDLTPSAAAEGAQCPDGR